MCKMIIKRGICLFALFVIGFIFLISLIGFVNAADGDVLWAKNFGGIGTDQGLATDSDANGNIFVAGSFAGTANFGPCGSLISNGSSDIFVAKYSSDGTTCLWIKRFGGTLDDQARAIAIDKNTGDVGVSGYFTGNISFGSSSYSSKIGSSTNPNLVTRDAYVVKLSGSLGTPLWSKQIGGESVGGTGHDYGDGLAIDSSNGDVVLVGTVQGFIDFGGGSIYTASMNDDSFIVKYNSTGSYKWAKLSNDYSPDYGLNVVTDNVGNIFFAGRFIDVGPDWGGGVLPSSSNGKSSSYLVKFTSSGAHVWSKSFFSMSIANVIPAGVTVDGNGNVVLIGNSDARIINLGCGNLSFPGLVNNGFLAKFSSSAGSCIWSRALVADVSSSPAGVAVDGRGNVGVAGLFQGVFNLSGAILTSVGGIDLFTV